MAKRLLRKTLSAPGLLREVRACFDALNDPVPSRGLSLAECLMSGLAVFGLKYPSLLQFDRDARTDEVVRANLRSLYGIERAPSDTALRERLDEVDPRQLRDVFKRVFALLQRGKALEGFTCLDGHYLLSVDGTGYFSSSSVHCAQCCEKHHHDGRTTYYHQMLGAVLVHPHQREVFPLAPEPIVKGDGAKKNDCERNAAKRLLSDVRREHPHLKLVVVEDGLASNGPHIKHLKALELRFIVGAKRSDHKALFEWVDATARLARSAVKRVEHTDGRVAWRQCGPFSRRTARGRWGRSRTRLMAPCGSRRISTTGNSRSRCLSTTPWFCLRRRAGGRRCGDRRAAPVS